MKCPQCSGTLVTLEFDRIEIDYCTLCRGIWLDSGELELLTAREGADDALLKTARPSQGKEKKRKCPICLKGMKKMFMGESEPVLLDQCPGHGFWFDQGELDKVLRQSCTGSKAGRSSLLGLLGEVFVPCTQEKP